MKTIVNQKIINDPWLLTVNSNPNASYPIASEFDGEEAEHIVLDYNLWKKLTLPLRAHFHAIVLACNEELDLQPEELQHLNLIAIGFTDSDSFFDTSLVKNLKETLGFKGEIRAINVNQQSAKIAKQSGFDSVELSRAA
ncbi:MAG: hypothetical protein ACI9J2_000595 [Saprospiraceae bacterium]|jgi:uncharacterized protein (DUF934 family)